MVGPIVQWASSLLLVGVFALLIPLSSQRRAVLIWMTAWLAQVVALCWIAALALLLVFSPHGTRPGWIETSRLLYWPARFVFLAAVALGSLVASRRAVSVQVERLVLLLAASVGLLLTFLQLNMLATRIELVATPLIFFGCAQLVLARAVGRRGRGLLFLGFALTAYGTLSTLYLMANFQVGSTSRLAAFIDLVARSSGYGDAICLALLSAAAIVVIVQESFVESARAHAAHLHDVAASEARLNGIIQAAREAIVTVDGGGRIDLLNGAAAELFRMPPREAMGRAIDSFIPEAGAALHLSVDAVGSAGLTTNIGRAVRSDGTTFPLEFTVGRLSTADQSGSVLVLRDLTARYAAEAEREAFDRRMAESEKMLAIGRVVSGVAHELNNPLAVVLGQSEQLADSAPTGEIRTGLRLIHEQAHRARHIVKDLLAFVRQRQDTPEVVNLGTLAERTAGGQLESAMHHAVSLVVDLPTNLPLVRVDRAAVEQILVNLIDNGLDAAGTDGTVRISASAGNGRVELAVEDTGHGIPVEITGRIFEPFFTTKGPGSGTGLGLSVSRELAGQQGGELRLENRPAPGVGARFILSLPIAPPDVIAAAAGTRGAVFPPPPIRGDGTAAAVLVVDDEPAVRLTLGKMFIRGGWQVREAGNAADALSWLLDVGESDAPAVILCDLKMPGMSGHDLYGQLAPRRPDLVERFIFVTGDVVESMSNGFIAESGRQVVEKPFTIAEIASAVEKVVRPA